VPSLAITPTTTARTGRLWSWLGLAATFLGITAYMMEFLFFKHLGTPWYAPLLATLGAALGLLSFGKRRTILRFLTLILLVFLAGFEWFWMFSFTTLPQYNGPSAGESLPLFEATLANGQPFRNTDLSNGTPTAVIFFRGHW
jgi:hypothetical protein